ncbi:MAG TPA: hypothetical protein PLU22_02170 [Polyangiaceae bacterium]|nr:hypothetical protein [Polyangiaceae bacterium]
MTDPDLERAWQAVLDRWEEDPAHQAFFDYCVATDRLAAAAACYRGQLPVEERRERAARRLEAIALLAIARLEASRTPAPRLRLQGAALGLVVLLLAAALALIGYLVLRP